MAFDLDGYRRGAECFCEELGREYYLHLAGRKPELELEPVYSRHAGLFDSAAVARLRELAAASPAAEERRRLRHLLHFAFDGLIGREIRSEAQELARLEASLQVAAGDARLPYRAVPIEQANEPDRDRRAALEAARNALIAERLDPLHRAALERSHDLCSRFGWPSYAAAYADLREVDLAALERHAARFLDQTADPYPGVIGAELQEAALPPLGELRRSDLPRLFRAPRLDGEYPAGRLLESFDWTLAGLGIRLAGQGNVRLDTESRPTKSPRAFCSTPRVPQEIYLVIAPTGGRDDYAALFHEGGHAEHYAHTDAALPFEYRHLGDNSVTESFAFALEHLVSSPAWLRDRLGVADPGPSVAHARAFRLLMVRRYAAKLAYELELHGPAPPLGRMPDRYAELLSAAVALPWPRETWLADVDDGFYAACYLRAWALEAHWRHALVERFGERWFDSASAGEWLRSVWRQGQRLGAEELLSETLGRELDFGPLAEELTV